MSNEGGESVQVSHELLQMPCRRTLPLSLQSAIVGAKNNLLSHKKKMCLNFQIVNATQICIPTKMLDGM